LQNIDETGKESAIGAYIIYATQ